jgi:proline iminopeptidase
MKKILSHTDHLPIFTPAFPFETSIPDIPRLCASLKLETHRFPMPDGCDLHVELEGSLDAPPIILINGGPGGTHHSFHPHFSTAATFSRVIYYDQRGCGLSGRNDIETPYTTDLAIEDLEALRQSLKLEKWTLLGHSYGGYLAQCYAHKYPEHVAGLVLVCASPAMPHAILESSYSKESVRIHSEKQAALFSAKETAYRKWLPSQFPQIFRRTAAVSEEERPTIKTAYNLFLYNLYVHGKDWKRQSHLKRKPSIEQLAHGILYEWDHAHGFNHQMSEEYDKTDLRGVFLESTIPTFLVESKNDLSWPSDKIETIRNEHPNAKFLYLEDSAHTPFKDEPDTFFPELERFITESAQH